MTKHAFARLALTLLTAAAFTTTAVAQDAPTDLRLAHNMPLTHHMHAGAESLAKTFNASNKKYRIVVYGAGQLYNEKALVQAVSGGALDIAFATSGFWSGTAPTVSVSDYPLLFPTAAAAKAAYEGQMGKAIAAQIERENVKVLGWFHFGFNDVLLNNKRPIKTVQDLKGLRMRTPNPLAASVLKAAGAGPVVLSATEVYLAMQRGTIDGTLTGATAVVQRKFYEVAKYATVVPFGYSAQPVTISMRAWNKLSPEEQKSLQAAVTMAADETMQSAVRDADAAIAEFSKHMQVNRFSPAELATLAAMAQPVANEYLKQVAGDDGIRVLELARADVAKVR
jgi:tripartite ATP-independent transporter DctP family solute receptor